MTTQNFPEAGSTNTDALSNLQAIEIDFVNIFGDNLTKFVEALGVTRMLPLSSGSIFRMYKAPKVDLQDGNVAEGDLIPLSQVKPQEAEVKEITLKKYRKQTTAEAISRYGNDNAVNLTDEALVREIQKAIRDDLFDMITTHGTEEGNLKEGTLQGALATAWGALQTLFEDDALQTIAFVNPMDVAKEIANKELTLETEFGLSYYTTATGTIVFTSAQIPKGEVYATAPDNLVVGYINAGASETTSAFELTADELGFIALGHNVDQNTATINTVAYSGIAMFPERLDGVIKVLIEETPKL